VAVAGLTTLLSTTAAGAVKSDVLRFPFSRGPWVLEGPARPNNHVEALGYGLVSGYSSSGRGTRPKYCWFFEEPALSSCAYHWLPGGGGSRVPRSARCLCAQVEPSVDVPGSLRFSAQWDGIQDFEYLRVLEERLRQVKLRAGEEAFWLDPRQRPLELCRRVIWSFHEYTRNPDLMLGTRRAIAEELEALQAEPRLVVQTSPPEGTVADYYRSPRRSRVSSAF